MPTIRLKRAYEPSEKSDGVRVLVERLWPRGISKETAALDHWVKNIAPSPELRKWYGHDPDKWLEFRERYLGELRQNEQELNALRAICEAGKVTFIFAAKDEERNSAVVLRDYLIGD